LRHQQGIIEYSQSPDCILRIQRAESSRALVLSDGTALKPGDPILNLHFWNEHIPTVPEKGMSWAWAKQVHLCLTASLSELAQYLKEHSEFRSVRALRADVSLDSTADPVLRGLERYGFEFVPDSIKPSFSERLHRLGENILISLFVLADNPKALRSDTLWRGRIPAYLSRNSLESKYSGR
jgi:hypothetical protein